MPAARLFLKETSAANAIFHYDPSVKTQRRVDRSLPGVALYNNKITLIYAQIKAEGIQNRFVPPERIAKEKVRCFEQRTFWWGAQWDSNPINYYQALKIDCKECGTPCILSQ